MVFLPYEDAQFVAKVQKPFVVGVMRRSHRVGAEIFEKEHIMHHRLIGEGAAEVGVVFMAAQPADAKRLSVE